MKQAVRLLEAARDLIEHVGWTKRAYAKNAKGKEVSIAAPTACEFCARGAVLAAQLALRNTDMAERVKADLALDQAMLDLYPHRGYHVVEINDHRNTTKADVLAAFDLAIKELS